MQVLIVYRVPLLIIYAGWMQLRTRPRAGSDSGVV